MPKPDADFWRGRRVLVTGHTGFKGSWLSLWLQRMGARVSGIALPPNSHPALYTLADVASGMSSSAFLDIGQAQALCQAVAQADPEVVFHLAAQPLVRRSYREPLGTLGTNIMGTAHLLEALRDLPDVRVAVMVTTDKVYANREWDYPYRESDALGGHDPYSASKAASEIVIDCYRQSFLTERGVAVASARAGNVIGGGDWSEDRLLPDAIRAWQAGHALEVRRPAATRPWQHVLEPLLGYLVLAQGLWDNPGLEGAYNFGPATAEAASVRDVVNWAQQAWGSAPVQWGNGEQGPHEAGWLALEVARAHHRLGVHGRWSAAESVHRSVRWYARQLGGADARELCMADLNDYESQP